MKWVPVTSQTFRVPLQSKCLSTFSRYILPTHQEVEESKKTPSSPIRFPHLPNHTLSGSSQKVICFKILKRRLGNATGSVFRLSMRFLIGWGKPGIFLTFFSPAFNNFVCFFVIHITSSAYLQKKKIEWMKKVHSNEQNGEARDYSRASIEICWRLTQILIQILCLAQSRVHISLAFET